MKLKLFALTLFMHFDMQSCDHPVTEKAAARSNHTPEGQEMGNGVLDLRIASKLQIPPCFW
jgi:hypothetical protein